MTGVTPIATRGETAEGRRRHGRYELGALLGRGGMAEVFAGHTIGDHGFSKPVAIKRLLPDLAVDEVFVERLIEEAKLLVGLAHGNIVSVMDLARDGDDVFLVMEFVDGPSLRQLLKGRGQRLLSFGTTCYVITAAATGLEFAHRRSVIHADISPSNILLTTSGEVRVADFGIARTDGSMGPVEGKWAYMAPEQARGERLDAASDVFALGVTMYELLTGHHPFGRGVSQDDRAHDMFDMRVAPPRAFNPAIPAGLDAICMRMLAVDRRDRFHTMQQVIDAITDERYTNRYREGAADLASAITEIGPIVAAPLLPIRNTAVKTKTDRPAQASGHTIVTRSLLGAPRSASAGEAAEPSSFAKGTVAARGEVMTPVPAAQPGRNKWAIAMLGVAGLVGAVAAVGLASSGDNVDFGASSAAGLARAEVTEPAVAPPPATTPSTFEPTLPAVATTIAPTTPVAQPPEPVKATPSIRPTPSAPKAVKKEPGSLRLTTSTWAYASIDGGAQQEITLVKKFSLAPGKHTVRVFNNDLGFKAMSHTFTVETGKTHVVKVDLESGSLKESD